MALTVQFTFDCHDPHAMARFWAAALGYQKEDYTPLVESVLASGQLPFLRGLGRAAGDWGAT